MGKKERWGLHYYDYALSALPEIPSKEDICKERPCAISDGDPTKISPSNAVDPWWRLCLISTLKILREPFYAI